MSFVQAATQYARDVVAGDIPACIYVKQACQRQLDNLENPPEGYHFDEDKAERIGKFVELMPHIKGEWAKQGKTIDLEPWQAFILTTVFGWVDQAGNRRFKTVYTEVPRKNAKSTLSSGVGNYLLAADGEEGAEVYSAATTRDQAKIVWNDAKRMADRSAGLQERFGVTTGAHAITVDDTASTFKALSRDQGGNLDGLNIHGAIVDELHAHKTRDVWDVIETGTGARSQPLLWAITTAGFNRAGICYEQRAYVLKVLSGAAVDEEYFGIIWTVDPEDLENEERLFTDPELWAKANPNWGVSVKPADIARKARKALEMPSARNNFLTKHLNVWVNADVAWMDLVKWEQAGDHRLAIDQFEGQKCWVAIDLASKLDIAPIAIVFRDGEQYTGFVKSYLPEETIENGDNSQYAGWVTEGWITETPGSVIDQGQIEEDLRELAERFEVQEVVYDPWQATYLATRLMDEGLPMIEYRQTVQNMSEPMKHWEALVVSGDYHHDANPCMTWMVSNVVCHVDAKENIYPRKEFPQNKIDGPVAMIMAIGRAMADEDTTSPYESRGLRTLN